MSVDRVEPFPDNWTYLKAELNWLDHLLSVTVARQRQEAKEIDRVARSRVDRATSHWWKGLINLESETAGDSPAETRRKSNATKGSYQQQLAAKILATQERGIWLGLPALCQRLQLSTVEKNVILMALAPEINRRYAKLYNCLQETEQPGGLPTVDLILRILCRNDAEWRSARHCLTAYAPLVQQGLIELLNGQTDPLLSRPVRLVDPLVDYLLADQTSFATLEQRLCKMGRSTAVALKLWHPPTDATIDPWATLVLPQPLLMALKHLCDRNQFVLEVDTLWGFQPPPRELSHHVMLGSVALLVGAGGTGKTTAACTIAQTLRTPLAYADLAFLNPAQQLELLDTIATQAPAVLLLQSAQVWFGRSSPLPEAELRQFLHHRQTNCNITLLAVESTQPIKPSWQRNFTIRMEFPIPDPQSRLQLWQQAFPDQAPIAVEMNWTAIAQQFRLTGGEIRAIAREAALLAAAESTDATITMRHLLQACRDARSR
jgi:hypothetical protein